MRQTKKLLCIALFLCPLTPQPTWAQEDANSILDKMRSTHARISQPLSGRLRPENGESIPFQLQLEGAEFDCKFTNPPETIKILLTDTESVLTDLPAPGKQVLSGAKFSEPVRGTDVTYEDLSLRFIYWKSAKYEGEQRVRTITCSIVLVQPSSRDTEYGAVRLWVAKNQAALIKAEAFNRQGIAVKRFEVISAQQIEGQAIFKQIRIERLDPQNGKVLSRTYLEVDSTGG
jgi:hypothetical protein